MLYTSAEANKLLKRIESRISDLKDKEEKSSSFKVASGEDVESLRPKYDFAETQALLDELGFDVEVVERLEDVTPNMGFKQGYEVPVAPSEENVSFEALVLHATKRVS